MGRMSEVLDMKQQICATYLFPGQGAYQPGALAAAAQLSPHIEQVLQAVDTIARPALNASMEELLLDSAAASLPTLLEQHPDALQMAIYAAAIASYRMLEAEVGAPALLVGHSFGEIAALVASRAFSIEQGAQIVLARCHALESAQGLGYMAAISASADRCQALIDMLDRNALALAVENSPHQTVVSGPAVAMDRLALVAQSLGLSFTRIASAYPFHSGQLTACSEAFRAALAQMRSQPLQVPVYSPILQRSYTDSDDLGTALASHLIRPVRFAPALRRPDNIWKHSAMLFVEMGASNALTKIVRQVAGPSSLFVLAPFAAPSSVETITQALHALRGRSEVVSVAVRSATTSAPAPTASPSMAPARSLDRTALQREIVELFAQAMEYPPEVFTEDVQLEAELGIDSVKQMELLGKLEQQYRLPARPEHFRLSDYSTMGRITDFVLAAIAHTDSFCTPAAQEAQPKEAAVPAPVAAKWTRGALQAEIVALFAQAMEYPAEVFTDDVALEAELGIDSVKQMELLGKLEQQYRLPARPEDFRLSDYGTVGKITDFVLAALNAGHASSRETSPIIVASASAVTRAVSTPSAPAANSDGLSRAALQSEIVALFAQAMEYPPEVFTEDVELEGELGIDSVKQMELLGKLEQRYRLPARPEDFRLSDYGTLRKITDFVFAAINGPAHGTRARAPLYAVG